MISNTEKPKETLIDISPLFQAGDYARKELGSYGWLKKGLSGLSWTASSSLLIEAIYEKFAPKFNVNLPTLTKFITTYPEYKYLKGEALSIYGFKVSYLELNVLGLGLIGLLFSYATHPIPSEKKVQRLGALYGIKNAAEIAKQFQLEQQEKKQSIPNLHDTTSTNFKEEKTTNNQQNQQTPAAKKTFAATELLNSLKTLNPQVFENVTKQIPDYLESTTVLELLNKQSRPIENQQIEVKIGNDQQFKQIEEFTQKMTTTTKSNLEAIGQFKNGVEDVNKHLETTTKLLATLKQTVNVERDLQELQTAQKQQELKRKESDENINKMLKEIQQLQEENHRQAENLNELQSQIPKPTQFPNLVITNPNQQQQLQIQNTNSISNPSTPNKNNQNTNNVTETKNS